MWFEFWISSATLPVMNTGDVQPIQRVFKGFKGISMNEMDEIDLVVAAQAGEIFFAALDYETDDERRAFVEEACFGDAELRQAVDGLFELAAASEGFFENVAAQLVIPAKDLVEILDNRLEALRTGAGAVL